MLYALTTGERIISIAPQTETESAQPRWCSLSSPAFLCFGQKCLDRPLLPRDPTRHRWCLLDSLMLTAQIIR